MTNILLIHPDLSLRDELTFALQHSGFRVSSSVGGQEALTEIHRRYPDLIIMAEDCHRMNGDELCIRIRETCQSLIIVLGQDYEEAAGMDMLEMGADAYLTSPLNFRELLARVCSLLRRYLGADVA